MKRIISISLVFILLISMLTACGANDEKKALSRIDEFITALEKGDTKTYIKCLDPDIQTIIESGTNSLGSALGIDNAYGLSSSASSLLNSAMLESTDTKISFEQKEIKSSNITEDKASFYIVYVIKIESKYLDTPAQGECTIEFKLVKKAGKWYIYGMSELSEKTDTDILAEGLNIKYGTAFSDGVAFVKYMDENENYKTAAIDTTGNILFEPDENFDLERATGYKNGIMVIDNLIYDKTGKIIASPEITGYDKLISKNCNGFVLAMKTEESFSGDKHSLGVLNTKGEWEYPLSAENPIVIEFNKEDDDLANISVNQLSTAPKGAGVYSDVFVTETINNTVLRINGDILSDFFYDITTNTLVNAPESDWVLYESRNYQGQDAGIYKYDLSGNRTLILKDIVGETFFENAFIGTTLTWNEDGYVEGGYKIYDYNGNVITDLSDYKFASNWSNNGAGKYYVNEHLLIPMDNGSGSKYLCLINKSGKTAFEPIKMVSGDDFYALDENGFVYKSVDENDYSNVKYKLYDYSGNITEYTDVAEFYGFNEGLALVKNTAGQYYYINIKGEKVIK